MNGLMDAFALLVALLVDRFVGEPPPAWHPVVAMGRYLQWAGAWVQRGALSAPTAKDWPAGLRGAVAWCAGAALVLSLAWTAQKALIWGCAEALRWVGPETNGYAIFPSTGSVSSAPLAWVLAGLSALALGWALKPLMACKAERVCVGWSAVMLRC